MTGSQPISLQSLVVWNYNKSVDDTDRGVMLADISLDAQRLSPPGGTLLRKAPGIDVYDFGQVIPLIVRGGSETAEAADPPASVWTENMSDPEGARAVLKAAHQRPHHSQSIQQDFITPLLPVGFILVIAIKDTWGDYCYAGLCGLEVHDAVRGKCDVHPNCIVAVPYSVRILPGMQVRRFIFRWLSFWAEYPSHLLKMVSSLEVFVSEIR